MCFINKMDRIGASFERTFDEVRERLGGQPVALQLPIGEGPLGEHGEGFRGVIDLVGRRALYFDPQDEGTTIRTDEISEEDRDIVEIWRQRLLEAIVLLDDDVLETYVETDDLPEADIHRLLRQGTLARLLQPTFCGSALDFIGIQPLLDAVERYLPSPLDRPPVTGHVATAVKQTRKQARKQALKQADQSAGEASDELIERGCDPEAPFCGLVFKVQADIHGDLCFLRVYSGTLRNGSRVINSRTGDKELVNQLWRVQADSREKIETDSAIAGDIVGVIGPKIAVTGDTLCHPTHPILLEPIRFPETVISMAVEPETSAERKKLAETLQRLSRQDPTFRVQVSEETGQTIISGMGELHLEVIRDRMEREFGLAVRVHKPRVSYRETIREAVEVTGEFQRSSAGVTQFARVRLRVEPLPEDQSVEIENQLEAGTLSHELVEVIEEAVRNESTGGGMLGYPLMRVRLVILDVESREGETTDVALLAAASHAVHQGLNQAGIALLEPIMRLEVVTPDDFLGSIQADLNARRAVILSSQRRGDLAVLAADVALAEMFGYSTQVRSLSQGRASYSMEPLKYADAPPGVLEEMLG